MVALRFEKLRGDVSEVGDCDLVALIDPTL